MPKLKTHSSTKKRFKLTGSKLLLRRKAGANHFLAKKSAARKRIYAHSYRLSKGDKKRIKRALGI